MPFDVSGYIRRHLPRLHTIGGLLALRLTAVAHRLPGFDRILRRWYPPEVRLRHEFNRWAGKGLGANMERDRLSFTERVLDARDIAWESRTGMSLHVYSAAEYTSMLKARAWVDIHTEESLTNAEDQLSPGDNDHDRALLISAPTPTVQGNSSVSHR